MPNITDSDVFTDPVDIPGDGDAATGYSLLQFAQDLANRTRWLKNRSAVVQWFAASGTVTKPTGFHADAPVTVLLCGGGGGGAGGVGGGVSWCGGGGGGSGLVQVLRLKGSDFDGTETVTIGAGGAGGAGHATTATNGADGGPSSITLAAAPFASVVSGGQGGRRFKDTPPEKPHGGHGWHGGGCADASGALGGESFGGVRGQHRTELDGTGYGGSSAKAATVTATWFFSTAATALGDANNIGGGSGAPSGFPAFVSGFTAATAGANGSGGYGGGAGAGPGAGGGGGTGTSTGFTAGGAGASGFCVIIWGA